MRRCREKERFTTHHGYSSGNIFESFHEDIHKREIERAKSESITFDTSDDYTEGTLEVYLLRHSNLKSYTCHKGEVFGALKTDTIYPIELDADIQKFEVPADSGFPHIDGTNYPTFKFVARIIHKKAEESETSVGHMA